tara:strand:+ start:1310 stop:1492 length:183 start_codon:yes stop_codon:yes gene_type:complete
MADADPEQVEAEEYIENFVSRLAAIPVNEKSAEEVIEMASALKRELEASANVHVKRMLQH